MLTATVCVVFILIWAIVIWWGLGQVREQYAPREVATSPGQDRYVHALSGRPERPWFICCYCRAELHGYGHTLDNGDTCCSDCYSSHN
jgi:hypothetical protein